MLQLSSPLLWILSSSCLVIFQLDCPSLYSGLLIVNCSTLRVCVCLCVQVSACVYTWECEDRDQPWIMLLRSHLLFSSFFSRDRHWTQHSSAEWLARDLHRSGYLHFPSTRNYKCMPLIHSLILSNFLYSLHDIHSGAIRKIIIVKSLLWFIVYWRQRGLQVRCQPRSWQELGFI